MQRHSRQHHRIMYLRWYHRRHRRLTAIWPWMNLPHKGMATHAPKRLLGKKRKSDRRTEERRFRQQVRRACHHGEPLPRYRHDYAD